MSGGELERAVRADIAAVVNTAPFGESLAELATLLAGVLTDLVERPTLMTAHYNPASLSRELRAVLGELAAASVGDDDDLAAALSRITNVPTEVRDTPQP